MPHRATRRRHGLPPERSGAAAIPVGPVEIATGTVEVLPEPDGTRAVSVLVNGVPSSHLDLQDPTRLEFEYMQHMAAVLDLLPAGPLDALHLGAGACSMPRWIHAARPGSRQLAVDVDARLLELVRSWFDLPRSPSLRLRAGDARAELATVRDASVDVVVRDVFAGDVTPTHLTTAEFVADAARALRPGGLYLANCADRPPLALVRQEVATAREVLPVVAVVAEPGQLRGRRYGNLVVAACRPAGPDLRSAALERAVRSLPVPARVLTGTELDAFVAGARVRRDASV